MYCSRIEQFWISDLHAAQFGRGGVFPRIRGTDPHDELELKGWRRGSKTILTGYYTLLLGCGKVYKKRFTKTFRNTFWKFHKIPKKPKLPNVFKTKLKRSSNVLETFVG